MKKLSENIGVIAILFLWRNQPIAGVSATAARKSSEEVSGRMKAGGWYDAAVSAG